MAYGLSQYVGATDDLDFLVREGIDILVETARLWADLGFWRKQNGDADFHIHGVTGPDEYTTVVNDNTYTNVLARFNLRRAADAVAEVRQADADAYDQLVRRTGLADDEVEEWREAAAGMHIPFDEAVGIHPQDSRFLDREMWDVQNTPLEVRPLLLHHHPLVIYRFQVLKQADVVLALFLQGEEFTYEEKLADFSYYDPITTGDSTLSAVAQSIVAAEVGYHELAYSYFLRALFVDLADLHANTSDGVHVASVGGVWGSIVFGFGGFRDVGAGRWTFDPRLPDEWEGLTFRLTLRGTRLKVSLGRNEICFEIEDGDGPLSFAVRGEEVTVTPEAAGRRRPGRPGATARGRPGQPGRHRPCRRHRHLGHRSARGLSDPPAVDVAGERPARVRAMGDYRRAYDRSIADPEGLLGRAGRARRLVQHARAGARRQRATVLPVVPRGRSTPATTPSTATSSGARRPGGADPRLPR